MLTRTMRALAHRNGCSLMFTSTQNKEHLNKTVRYTLSLTTLSSAPSHLPSHFPSLPHCSLPSVSFALG